MTVPISHCPDLPRPINLGPDPHRARSPAEHNSPDSRLDTIRPAEPTTRDGLAAAAAARIAQLA